MKTLLMFGTQQQVSQCSFGRLKVKLTELDKCRRRIGGVKEKSKIRLAKNTKNSSKRLEQTEYKGFMNSSSSSPSYMIQEEAAALKSLTHNKGR